MGDHFFKVFNEVLVICPTCKGEENVVTKTRKCPKCQGSGWLAGARDPECCNKCNGKGKLVSKCFDCDGLGLKLTHLGEQVATVMKNFLKNKEEE